MSITLEAWMKVASAAQSMIPILSLCAYIPQWRKLFQTRNSGAISVASWAIWAVSYSIAVFYATLLLKVTGRGIPLVVTTSAGLCFVLFTMVLVWRFRERPN
ncbi:MAG: hypothetical protein RLZZ245_279 [Verrucomicrobiota bacterium]|jgi:uncharacterized protein with PQ loop repeat